MKLKDTLNPMSKALSNRFRLAEALFKRSDSLSQLLPYSEYIDEFKTFINKDGSLGVVFEVELLEHEPMPAKGIISAVESFKSLFALPENCVLQVLFDQSYISKKDRVWDQLLSKHKYSHPVSEFLYKRKNQDDSKPM